MAERGTVQRFAQSKREVQSLRRDECHQATSGHDRGDMVLLWEMADVTGNQVGSQGGFCAFEKTVVGFVFRDGELLRGSEV